MTVRDVMNGKSLIGGSQDLTETSGHLELKQDWQKNNLDNLPGSARTWLLFQALLVPQEETIMGFLCFSSWPVCFNLDCRSLTFIAYFIIINVALHCNLFCLEDITLVSFFFFFQNTLLTNAQIFLSASF